jgi:hypothetical protein
MALQVWGQRDGSLVITTNNRCGFSLTHVQLIEAYCHMHAGTWPRHLFISILALASFLSSSSSSSSSLL